MAVSRVIRGFRRLGIVLAVPFFAIALFHLVSFAMSEPEYDLDAVQVVNAADPFAGWRDLGPNAPPQKPNCAALPCRRDRWPLFLAAVFSGAAVGIFSLSLGIGWVIAGFAKD